MSRCSFRGQIADALSHLLVIYLIAVEVAAAE
jgi:hypothetical protein